MGRTTERSGLQRGSVDSGLRPQRATRKPPAQEGAGLLDAQRAVGNQDLQRRLGLPVQPKLTVNSPGDAYEMEADRMADAIVKSPDRPGAAPKPVGSVLQRKPTEGSPQRAPEKKADDKKKPDAQKAPDKKSDDKKKPDAQKAPEKKADDKKKPDAQKAPEKKADDKKKPDAQKAPEKKADDKKKPDAQKAPEKKADDKKKPDAQKAPEKKSDEKKPDAQKAPDKKSDDKKKPDAQRTAQESKTLEQEALERGRRADDDAPGAAQAVQAKEDDAGGGGLASVPEDVERVIVQHRGRGEPLSPEDRAFLEPRFGQDLSGVRIHTDGEAQRAAQRLSAKAFTVGRDIYFAPGKFAPQTSEGLHLLAHEVTHTLQQQPSGPPKSPAPAAAGPTQAPAGPGPAAPAAGKAAPGATGAGPTAPLTPAPGSVVQRLPAPGPGIDPATFGPDKGTLDEGGKKITFDHVKIPSFKNDATRGPLYSARAGSGQLKRPRNYRRAAVAVPDQKTVWENHMASGHQAAHETKLRQIAGGANNQHPVQGDEPVVLKQKRGQQYFIGDVPTLAHNLFRPTYNRGGTTMYYHVDHIVELQLNGTNAIDNMELLHGPPNTQSGDKIQTEIVSKVNSFLRHLKGDPAYAPREDSVGAIKRDYDLVFQEARTGDAISVSEAQRWKKEEIEQGAHLTTDLLEPSSFSQMGGGGTDRFFLFRGRGGGTPDAIAATGNVALDAAKSGKWFKPFTTAAVAWSSGTGEDAGTIDFELPAGHKHWSKEGATTGGRTTIKRFPNAPRAGYVDMTPVLAAARSMKKKGMSPIEMSAVESTDNGLSSQGVIRASLPLIQGTAIDFEMTGDDIFFSKTFDITDFKSIPPPLRISQSSLTVEVGTAAPYFRVFGQADFEVDRLGRGYVAGSASAQGFDLEGKFAFDSRLFDPAEITLRYQNEQFSAEGRLGIKAGTVPGVQSATITARYGNEVFELTGTAQLNVPGVERAALGARYSEAEGLEISGSATLSGSIPGIQGGELAARLRKKPDGSWETFATGTARPALPVAASLTITYENGALTIEGTGEYNRGMLRGSMTLGATNRPLGDDGRPAAGAPGGDTFRAYGGGSVTIRFSPWLQGTVGIRLTPEGEVEVSGEVALPSALDLIPEKSYSRTLVSIGLDIPIVGVAVAGQRIGIFATIRGSLTFNAGIGPGQLQDLALGVTYNPSREEDTRVHGRARLHVPAHAGLRLAIQGGIGAGIPIVSATAGLEIGGELGVEGALSAGVDVDWTPARGLVIDASAEIYAQPKLKFDVSGFVLVEADLLLTTIELYSKRWQLAALELGSNLRLGMRLPLHYEQGRDFDVSWDQVEFTIPDVDPADTLRQLIDRVV